MGFGLVLVLLMLAVYLSHRVQQSSSEGTLEIYRRHVEQDQVLYNFRRTLWLAAVAARDFLLNPNPDRQIRYTGQINELRMAAERLTSQLGDSDKASPSGRTLRVMSSAYWKALEDLPVTSAGFNEMQRYEFVQTVIVPRRNAVGDLLRKFAELTQETLRADEAAFARNRRESAARLFLLLSGCGLLGLLIIGLSLSHSESLERANAAHFGEVERAREELRQLTGRLMEVQEEERARISRELHDEIAQSVATLRLEILRAERVCREKLPEVLDRLGRARVLAERTMSNVRNMSALLRPSLLDDLGMVPAVRWLAEEFGERAGISVTLDVTPLPSEVCESVAVCVFRVLQEALHNVEKHAGATEVKVRGAVSNGRLLLSVADNGVGFAPRSGIASGSGLHLGIAGMRERAAALGGTLRISSTPSLGTELVLDLPMLPPPEPAVGPAPRPEQTATA